MPDLDDFRHIFWLITIAGGAVTAVKLYWLGLHRVYQFFFTYLALRTLRSGGMWFLEPHRNLYGWTWVLTQPLVWLFYVLIVLELYSLVLRSFRGIYTMSRWLLAAGLGLGVGISALSFLATRTNAAERSPVLQYYTMIERGLDVSLVIFLLVLVAFLAWYPVPLNRNTLAHAIVYCVFFVSDSAVLLIRNLGGSAVNPAVNVGVLGISSLCVILWAVLFTRRGEERKAALLHAFPPGEEARLIGQLAALNRTLTRSGRD